MQQMNDRFDVIAESYEYMWEPGPSASATNTRITRSLCGYRNLYQFALAVHDEIAPARRAREK